MATLWADPPNDEDDGRRCPAASTACEAKRTDGRERGRGEGVSSTGEEEEEEEEELFSWPGPKTLRLLRTSQGFGFTLRHFIVYPPESAVSSRLQEEDRGRRGRPRNRLEPMDTIFVKQVKEGGPAHGAGLCTGDRIVKVNGESIIGKTYSQVIALIQNRRRRRRQQPQEPTPRSGYAPVRSSLLSSLLLSSLSSLSLCLCLPLCPSPLLLLHLQFSRESVAPAYSQDAYQKGHGSYSGNALHIPEPPPLRYPRVEPKPGGMSHSPEPAPAELAYRLEIPVPPSPPPTGAAGQVEPPGLSGVCHRTEEWRYGAGPPDPSALRTSRPAPAPAPAPPPPGPFQPPGPPRPPTPLARWTPPCSPPGCPASVRTSLAEPNHYAPPLPHSSSASSANPAPASRQSIDWRTYTTYREYVDSRRIRAYGGRTIQERLDSFRAAEYDPASRGSPGRRRSTSHDRAALHHPGPAPCPAPPPRSISHDRLGLGLGGRPAAAAAPPRDWTRPAPRDSKPRARSFDFLEPSERRGFGRAEPDDRLQQGRPPGAQPLPLQRPGAAPPHLHHQQPPLHRAPPTAGRGNSFRAGPAPAPGLTKGTEQLLGSHADAPKEQRPAAVTVTPSSNGKGAEPAVVLREKPPTGRLGPASQPLRHPSYILAVSESDAGPAPVPDSACWLPNDARRELRIQQQQQQQATPPAPDGLDQSLDSIPFIDEPASPSADRDAAHIPASAVISVSPAITAIHPCPLMRRQLSHDQESLRHTVLESESGPKSERSKSYDEGLDDYREEGRARTSIKHLTSLRGLRKALDGHKSSDDSGSRKDSSSDIFSDSSKEGWLHFRQLNTEKSKRVGGGMRPWKLMYVVLRGHALYLYKDRKEGLAHAAAAAAPASSPSPSPAPSQPDCEPQPIGIRACLIDISYSDTKRKNVLRLTTSACEYLFQAADREDMLAWIRVIQGNSNLGNEQSAGVTSQDLISRKIKEYNTMMNSPSSKSEPSPKPSRPSLSIRQALLGGKGEGTTPSPPSPRHNSERKPLHRDESSPPRDRGTWRRGITGLRRKPVEKKNLPGITFGVRLDDCPPALTNRFVPLIVEICCVCISVGCVCISVGCVYVCVPRPSVPRSLYLSLTPPPIHSHLSLHSLNSPFSGPHRFIRLLSFTLFLSLSLFSLQKWRDLNVISSLLKSFFRKLPEPLFTNEKYADFIDANRTEDAVERLKVLKTLLRQLPSHHYETLKFLSGHLKMVSENCEKNKMEPRNLAIVFGPTLVRTSEDNMTHMVTHMPDQYKIVETLIQHYDWFFTEEGTLEPTASVPQESAVESQPVPNIDHLLTNIGRTGLTSPGEVSDSPNSDSARSKGSWGSGKEQYSRELLRSSIFAAASRKRRKHKEKPLPSSSDDDLDAVFIRKESQNRGGPSPNPSQSPAQNQNQDWDQDQRPDRARRRGNACTESEDDDAGASQINGKQEVEPLPPETEPRGEEIVGEKALCPQPFSSPSLSFRGNVARQSSLSDPTSQCDDATSDLGTMNSSSSQASAPPKRPAPCPGPAPDPRGNEALAEVSSITSDYSTTSSLTCPFLLGAESSALSPEVRSVAESRGDEADDERSELVSEGRPAETDSESDFPVFPKPDPAPPAPAAPPPTPPPHPKTDSSSSAEGGRSDREPSALSRVLGAVKGRSSGSLSSSSKSEESEKAEPPWRLRITERLKLRLRSSADDMFGVSGGGGTPSKARSPEARRKKGIRRRHTMGGQRDFAQLAAVVNDDWKDGAGRGAELSAMDRLKPKCSSQDFSIRDWIVRERGRSGNAERGADSAPSAAATPTSPEDHPLGAEQLNGDSPQGKSKGALSLSADAHPHKLTGAQVVRSRFYQYL
ncbi:LOW QUALITY PROTEIN: rho GTPase-activating protein 21-like [Anguilla rostrata]|uniref:LOW QUALITY PROTEIN: rho GTPase-activating protein 21-like n=1 Tax=Anguilla rostrata TaxID=7938 RepID=UPI0030D067CE